MVCPNDSTIDYNSGDAGTVPMVQNLYQGMLQDAVTGLYYERNRNYSPSLGTWTSQDPLQYINGADTYQFVMGNPTGAVDPTGRSVGIILPPPRSTDDMGAMGYFGDGGPNEVYVPIGGSLSPPLSYGNYPFCGAIGGGSYVYIPPGPTPPPPSCPVGFPYPQPPSLWFFAQPVQPWQGIRGGPGANFRPNPGKMLSPMPQFGQG